MWQKSEKGEARIELYEDKNKVDKPSKVFFLRDIFRVSIKPATKEEFPFSIHMNDEILQGSCSSEEEAQQWVMDLITTRPHGADRSEVEPLGHVMIWRVTVLHKGISNIFNFQRNTFIFVLDEYSVGLINPDDHSDCWHWQMKNIRNCGHEGNCFVFECGRSSFCGEGHLYLQMYSSKLAKDAHHTVLEQMRHSIPDSTTEKMLADRCLEQTRRLNSTGRRPRRLSEPLQPIRTLSPPPASSRSRSVGKIPSNSINIKQSSKGAHCLPPTQSDDDSYMEMQMPSQAAIRERNKFSRSISREAEACSSSLEQLVSPSPHSRSIPGSHMRLAQSAHTIRVHNSCSIQTHSSPSQNDQSGYDVQATAHQLKRPNVFLQRQQSSDLCTIEDEEPQDYCQLSPQPTSPTFSPSLSPLSASPQLTSLDMNSRCSSCPSDSPKHVASVQELRKQKIERHVYEQVNEIADSGVFCISRESQSCAYSADEPYQEMNLQASRLSAMSFEEKGSSPHGVNTPRSQPVPVMASGHSHNLQSEYEVMSPQGKQNDPKLYEDMNPVRQDFQHQRPYVNHQLYQNHQIPHRPQLRCAAGNSVDDPVKYESCYISRSASSSPPKVH